MPFSDRTSWLLWLLIAAASVSITLFVVTTTISLDDPFIGLRYADNFVAGHGIVYNPHDPPVEGYTALLWILVAALGIAMTSVGMDKFLAELDTDGNGDVSLDEFAAWWKGPAVDWINSGRVPLAARFCAFARRRFSGFFC